MILMINVPEYTPKGSIRLEWEDNFTIETHLTQNDVLIKANAPGLISLARHLLSMAQPEVPKYYHLHFDDLNSLEPGSCELIIEKI